MWLQQAVVISSVALLLLAILTLGNVLLIQRVNELDSDKKNWMLDNNFSCIFTKYVLETDVDVAIYGHLLQNISIPIDVLPLQDNITWLVNNTIACSQYKQLVWYETFKDYDNTTLFERYPLGIVFNNCTVDKTCEKLRFELSLSTLNREIYMFMSLEYFSFALMVLIVIIVATLFYRLYQRKKIQDYIVFSFD